MPAFTYTGADGRYYPALSLTAAPGMTVEFDDAPTDGRWTPAVVPAPKPDPAPATAPEGAA